MKLLFLTVSLVTAFASEPGDSGSFTEGQHFPNGPGDYSYVDEALQMMDGRLVVADEQNNPIYPKTSDMSMLLGRSRWCRSRDGQCRRGKFSCPHKYESPYGRPYCTSKKRRCCYPATGPTSTTPTPISTTTSIPTTTVASTTRAHSTTTFPGSGWCSSRDGECRRGNYLCPYKYESPFGSPYCTSRIRRCCYPVSVPAGFEVFNGKVIRRTKTSDRASPMTYDGCMSFCDQFGAKPFIPRTVEDYTLYQTVRTALPYYMWLPANDRDQEGTLRWYNGEVVSNNSLWELASSTESYDCLWYGGSISGGAVHVYTLRCTAEAYPPICEMI